MHCYWQGASLRGVQGLPVRVEVQMARGLPALHLVGRAGTATRESRERVYGALRESGYALPRGRVTVNLAPADEPKEGTAFDLAMALGLLEVSGQLGPRRGREWWFLGELGLDGRLLPLRGALPLGLAAREAGARGLVLPAGNAAEAQHLDGLPLRLMETLSEVVGWVNGDEERARPVSWSPRPERRRDADTRLLLPGGPALHRAMVAAAAGRHNLLLIGAPGNGKTTLARALAALLPPLDARGRRELMALRSSAGLAVDGSRRPAFRAPHHSLSLGGLLGRSTGGGRPGEMSLAHRGLLFLDELPEFRREVLEAMREPMAEGTLRVARGNGSLDWPARFQLAAAMNPCPCGFSLRGSEHCRCTPHQVKRYRGRVSGALLDRIDLILEVPEWRPTGEGSPGTTLDRHAMRTLRARVARAARRLDRGGVAPLPSAERRWLDERLHEAGASLRQRESVAGVAASLAAVAGKPRPERRELLDALDLSLRWRMRFVTAPGAGRGS